jgi:outer membrane murein-binding lipoprotein Lpp
MKTSGLSLSIAVLAFGASTIYLAMELSKERAHSEQLADATRALNARIAELEKSRDGNRLAVKGTFGSVTLPSGTTLNAQLPPPPAASKATSDAPAPVAINEPVMPQGDAPLKMLRAQLRAHNKQMYADAGAQLGLNREETNKLINLLTDQQTEGIGNPRGVTDPAEIRRQLDEASRENKAKIASLLGPEKLKLFEEYQQSLPARYELDMLARQLEGSDVAPLDDDQRKRLLAALIEERKRTSSPQFSIGTDQDDFAKAYSEWQDDYNARVGAQARNILNDEQYAAFDDYQKWQREMSEQMTRAHIHAGGSGTVMFTTATEGAVAVEATAVTTSDSDEKPHKDQ